MALAGSATIGILAHGCITDVCGCPPELASAIVYGDVRNTAGEAVANLTIAATGVPPDSACQGFAEGASVSDLQGRYRISVGGFAADSNGVCLLLFARPAPGNLVQLTTNPVRLKMRYAPPFDSVRVDAVLPAAP